MPRLKRWESPRRQGRNDKGKGGAARKRQLKKRQQMLRNKLKGNGEGEKSLPFFYPLNHHIKFHQSQWTFLNFVLPV